MACSTVLALLFDWAAPLLPPLSMLPLLLCGSNAAISWSAVLMRFRRPCSAILWDVRLLVRFSDKASG